MKKHVVLLALLLPILQSNATSVTLPAYYGVSLCEFSQYECIKVSHGDSWQSLFPDEGLRDLVQRINRTSNSLWPGKTLAVPKDRTHATLLAYAPFAHKIAINEKLIIIDQDKLAWGAYNAQGVLTNWGPISSGRDKCPDSANSCLTLTGTYRVFSKENDKCKSDIFPIGKGGAKMPFCMYFHKGFALHGSEDIPGHRASHGCVRMFVKDAQWLNEMFVDVFNEKTNKLGTKVVVKPVTIRSSN